MWVKKYHPIHHGHTAKYSNWLFDNDNYGGKTYPQYDLEAKNSIFQRRIQWKTQNDIDSFIVSLDQNLPPHKAMAEWKNWHSTKI